MSAFASTAAHVESPRAAHHRAHADIFSASAVGSRENFTPVQRRLLAPGATSGPRHPALRAFKSPKVDSLTAPAPAPRRSSSRAAGGARRNFAVKSRSGRRHLVVANSTSTAFVTGGALDTSGHQNRVVQSAPQKVFVFDSQRAQTVNVSDGVGAALQPTALSTRQQAWARTEDAKPTSAGRKPVTAREGWGSNQAVSPTSVRVVGGTNTVRAHETVGAPNARERYIEAARGMRGGPKRVARKGDQMKEGGIPTVEEPKHRPHLRQSPTTSKKTDPVVQSVAGGEAEPQQVRCSRPVPGAPRDRVYRTVHGAPGPALLLSHSAASSTATTPTSAHEGGRGAALDDDDDVNVFPHPHTLQATRRHRIAGTRLIPSADNLLGSHARRVFLLHAPPQLQAAGRAEAAAAVAAEERETRHYGIRPAIAARHAVTLHGVHDGQPARRFKLRTSGASLGVSACLRVCVASRAHADAARRTFIASRAINQPRYLN